MLRSLVGGIAGWSSRLWCIESSEEDSLILFKKNRSK